MSCSTSASVVFSGVTFNGTPYGYSGNVNSTFTVLFMRPVGTTPPNTCNYRYSGSSSGTRRAYLAIELMMSLSVPSTIVYKLFYENRTLASGVTIKSAGSVIIFEGESDDLVGSPDFMRPVFMRPVSPNFTGEAQVTLAGT